VCFSAEADLGLGGAGGRLPRLPPGPRPNMPKRPVCFYACGALYSASYCSQAARRAGCSRGGRPDRKLPQRDAKRRGFGLRNICWCLTMQ